MDDSELWAVPEGLLANVHPATACAGRPCVLHDPMRTYDPARLAWRDDLGLFEVVCEHGVGHPAPEEAYHSAEIGRPERMLHTCDGCCSAWTPDSE